MSDFVHKETTAETAIALVVVAASAGGLQPLEEIVRGLPIGLPAALVIAQHMGRWSALPSILERSTQLEVAFATSGTVLAEGRVYVCPPDRHIAIGPDATIRLSSRERLEFLRPSVDWLLESAAASFRERFLAVILSGMRNDGSRGIRRVRGAGGRVVVQDPSTARFPEMPEAAIATGLANHVVAPAAIAGVIVEFLGAMDRRGYRASWDAPFGSAQSTR